MSTLGVPQFNSTSHISSLESSRSSSPSPLARAGGGLDVAVGGVHNMPSSSSMGTGNVFDDEDLEAADADIQFESAQEEAAYYREKYRRIADMLAETRAELDDFQASSRELEEELEKELVATEKQQEELKEKIKRLEIEKEEWKTKHVTLQKMHSSTVGAMQREMDNLRSERDKTLVALRDLEMGNDELERNERVAVSSLLDLESKYNRAIEEKTLLEQELIDKQQLDEKVQRLIDELRDANSEISILRDQASRAVPTPPSSVGGQPMSPVQEGSLEHSLPEIPSFISDNPSTSTLTSNSTITATGLTRSTVAPSPRGLTRSATLASMSASQGGGPSPIPRRTGGIPNSPSSLALGRSTNTSTSNSLNRAVSGIPPPSPSRTRLTGTNSGLPVTTVTQSRGAKGILRDLQARMRATDDKLGSKVPNKRNVSAPMQLPRRSISGALTGNSHSAPTRSGSGTKAGLGPSIGPTPARASRVAQLAKEGGGGGGLLSTPVDNYGDQSMMSSSSWIMITDNEGTENENEYENDQDSQVNGSSGRKYKLDDPTSPLDRIHRIGAINQTTTSGTTPGPRAVSAASRTSTRTLPTRPGIPSPLANPSLARSTSSSANTHLRSTTSGENGDDSGESRRQQRSLATSVSAPVSRPRSRTSLLVSSTPISASITRGSSASNTALAIQANQQESQTQSQLRNSMRSPSPAFGLHRSTTAATGMSSGVRRYSRPSSRADSQGQTGAGSIGRGPPPRGSHVHSQSQHSGSISVSMSASSSAGVGLATNASGAGVGVGTGTGVGLGRRPRRSSVGAEYPPTAIPGPKGMNNASSAVGTPSRSRPLSVLMTTSASSDVGSGSIREMSGFPGTMNGTPPPPVPRIPSNVLRDVAKEKERKRAAI